MAHEPHHAQYPPYAQVPAFQHAQQHSQGAQVHAAQMTAAGTRSNEAPHLQQEHGHGQAQMAHATASPPANPHSGYTTQLPALQQQQQSPPASQTYGVSFTGTAKFAPLPFPPCEHRLPPPATSTGEPVPPIATLQHPPMGMRSPPPPPYTERYAGPSVASSSGVVGAGPASLLANRTTLAHQSSLHQPLVLTGSPPPQAQHHPLMMPHALTPTPPHHPPPGATAPVSLLPHIPAATFPPSHNLLLVSAVSPPPPPPPSLPPIPIFLSATPPGMIPYGHHAPILTPWPPVPLRHIDSYLAGQWPPAAAAAAPMVLPTAQASAAPPSQHGTGLTVEGHSQHQIANTSMKQQQQQTMAGFLQEQQQPRSQTDLIAFPLHVEGAATTAPLPAPLPVPMLFSPPVVIGGGAEPLASSTTGVSAENPHATGNATAAATPTPTPCQVQGCQANSFCELSPCHCRICRDHLGWVMRGARVIDMSTGEEVVPDPTKTATSPTAGTETRKIYRCIACGWQSTMEGSSGPVTTTSSGGASPPQHRKTFSEGLPDSPESTTTTSASANANAFSIKYFSHGPVSHPQSQPQSKQDSSAVPAVPMGGGLFLSPEEEMAMLAGFSAATGMPFDLASARASLDPMAMMGESATFGAHYGPMMMSPMMEQPAYELRTAGAHGPQALKVHEGRVTTAAAAHHLSSSSGQKQSEQRKSGGAEEQSSPNTRPGATSATAESKQKGAEIHVTTATLPPRCSSAMASPTLDEPHEQPITLSPTQSRPASSPSALETAVEPPPTAGKSSVAPSPVEGCCTPSAPAAALFYSQAHGSGYGPMPSPPITRDDPYPFGYELPFFGNSSGRSGSHPSYASQDYVHHPIATSPEAYPPGSVPVQLPTAGLGLLGMTTPLSSYVTPPRTGHKKKQSYASSGGKSVGGGKGSSTKYQQQQQQQHAEGPGGGSGSGTTQQTPARTYPSTPLPPEVDGSLLEPREWPIVKIENIPFNTTVALLEGWLPRGVLAPASQVVLPIHLILHRLSGRTLPHCYIECVSQERAHELIQRLDRSSLGERTIRVKWERAGELLRDLFDQSVYFAQPSPSPAAAPLPHLPPEGFRLPEKLLTKADLNRLLDFCTKSQLSFRERPFERAFYNLASIIAKFPWQRKDLWDDELREELFRCAIESMRHGLMYARRPGGDVIGYRRMAAIINIAIQRCPIFSRSEKDQARLLLGSGPLSLTAPMTVPQVPAATECDFPPLQHLHPKESQHAKSPPPPPPPPPPTQQQQPPYYQQPQQPQQYMPMTAGLQTPPRATSKMRLPDSPETPTPIHTRAGPAFIMRSAVTTSAVPATVSTAKAVGPSAMSAVSVAAPRLGPSYLTKPGVARMEIGASAAHSAVTSRPLDQQGGAPSIRGLDAAKIVQTPPSTQPKQQPSARVPFPQQRAPVASDAAAAKVTPASGPPPTRAFGWMATPLESPIEERQRSKALAGQSKPKVEQKETTEKGWAQE
ncbi:hypothetical protein JCM10908_001808 [Rhodotorula pacifica]|uniref:uncharacterized protein n=1 Tax=Rhodotorula pacifica TaxID=1495444 RepID=UPI0031795412